MSIKSNEFSRANQQNQITQRRACARRCRRYRCRDHATAGNRHRQEGAASPRASDARRHLRKFCLKHASVEKEKSCWHPSVGRAASAVGGCAGRYRRCPPRHSGGAFVASSWRSLPTAPHVLRAHGAMLPQRCSRVSLRHLALSCFRVALLSCLRFPRRFGGARAALLPRRASRPASPIARPARGGRIVSPAMLSLAARCASRGKRRGPARHV